MPSVSGRLGGLIDPVTSLRLPVLASARDGRRKRWLLAPAASDGHWDRCRRLRSVARADMDGVSVHRTGRVALQREPDALHCVQGASTEAEGERRSEHVGRHQAADRGRSRRVQSERDGATLRQSERIGGLVGSVRTVPAGADVRSVDTHVLNAACFSSPRASDIAIAGQSFAPNGPAPDLMLINASTGTTLRKVRSGALKGED